jgi:hypothetical protein
MISDIALREVGADVFLANRVRSGRKQPQRDLHGSLPASYLSATMGAMMTDSLSSTVERASEDGNV